MVKEQRVLRADVYDTLELSALAYGGIGGGEMYERGGRGLTNWDAPFCILGHIAAVQNRSLALGTPLWNHLVRARLMVPQNDGAVQRINERKLAPANQRVSWKEYTRELNIVRGDS